MTLQRQRSTPVRRGPSPDKTARTRARLCNAALELFLRDGFEGTRMSDVAQLAGIAKGTSYSYFETKEALFEAVLAAQLATVLDPLRLASPEGDEPMSALLRRVVAPFLSDPLIDRRLQFMRIVMVEGGRFPSIAAAYRRAVLDPLLAIVRALATRARARGEISVDVLERLPMLLLAPGLLAMTWNSLFPAERLPPAVAFEGMLELAFSPGAKPDR
jgi:TetR/AcrR family transcriptional regulator of autoinduction and epiphytic fitness